MLKGILLKIKWYEVYGSVKYSAQHKVDAKLALVYFLTLSLGQPHSEGSLSRSHAVGVLLV